MFLGHSPPKRRQNRNQIKKSQLDSTNNPQSSTDASADKNRMSQNEHNLSGADRHISDKDLDNHGSGAAYVQTDGREPIVIRSNTPVFTVEQLIHSPLFNQTIEPIVNQMTHMRDQTNKVNDHVNKMGDRVNKIDSTLNDVLDKINELIGTMLTKEPEKNRQTSKSGDNPNEDETEHSADDEAVVENRPGHSERQRTPVSIQNKTPNNQSSAFSPYSRGGSQINPSSSRPSAKNSQAHDIPPDQRLNPLVVTHGSVERELRQVHFDPNLNVTENSNPLNANIRPLQLVNNVVQSAELPMPQLVRVKIARYLPNGEVINEETLITEQQYRQAQNTPINSNPVINERVIPQSNSYDRARSISRASTYSFNPNNIASSTQRLEPDYQSFRGRRGNLSWRSSDSSDAEQYNEPPDFTPRPGMQTRRNTQQIPRN